jgi:RNA polymerase sigma-70 factor (ECF subfamily)
VADVIGREDTVAAAMQEVATSEYARVLASVIGTVGDWTIAEDAVQDALARAAVRWQVDGVPRNAAAWVTTVARRRAIDLLRHEGALRRAAERLQQEPVDETVDIDAGTAFPRGDERLALIFTACHPALPIEGRAALALRTVLNVPVEQLARLFATTPDAMQKRLVRTRAKIKHAGIPYRVPDASELSARGESVREVLSGLFTIGYSDPSAGWDAGEDAIRLTRLCCALMSSGTSERLEFDALLALLLLQHARRMARTSAAGRAVVFRDQDRSLWDHAAISEGLGVLDDALARAGRAGVVGGRYLVKAAIAAEYMRPTRASDIDLHRIATLHTVLEQLDPSPFVKLNRAVAVANAGEHSDAMGILEEVEEALGGHHLHHAVRADVLARLGRSHDAARAFQAAAEAAPTLRERHSYLDAAASMTVKGDHADP